jgi:hypothetical protein
VKKLRRKTIVDKITIKQYDELYAERHNTKEFNKLLEEFTGIIAKPYTGYQYFDEAGNYVGDTEYNSVEEILKNAYIKIVNN